MNPLNKDGPVVHTCCVKKQLEKKLLLHLCRYKVNFEGCVGKNGRKYFNIFNNRFDYINICINHFCIKGGPVSGAKTLVTQVPTFVSSSRPVNPPSRSNITRQHSLCPNAILYDALTLSNAKKARSTR